MLFADSSGNVVVHQNHPHFKGFLPLNEQWQPHYTFPSHQFEKHCGCNQGECLSKTHVGRHKCTWQISIANPSSHEEQDGPNPVRQKPIAGQAWTSILVAWNMVIC
jgi:hypothetical protein